MHSYEVEIKSLLGSKENADALRERIFRLDPATKLVAHNSQLNHYFQGGNLDALAESVARRCLEEDKCIQFDDLARKAKTFSVRTRQKDSGVYLVVKASIDDSSSDNGISRIELDEKVDIPLDALDALILGSGFIYQAKWSRDREEYLCRGINICLDKNAGYGWLAEFEKMVEDREAVEAARQEIRALMRELDVQELPQDRLERMFSFYNAHWQEYYGTDKVFTVA
ncbi:MAG: CYTH domain-containing protein [Patescibacteria group bacterium]|nr:CYTH domain-containing protein [Patescibacteria group bacterium]